MKNLQTYEEYANNIVELYKKSYKRTLEFLINLATIAIVAKYSMSMENKPQTNKN